MSKSEWDITTDIYDIVDSVNKLKSKYVEDEDESTLALGIFGFLGDVEAKKIQTATIMAGELGNEMFPNRAKLNKNVLAHSIYCNIEGINAVPAHLTVNIGVREEDLDYYMSNNEFVFKNNTGVFIKNYEFRLDYDVILRRFKASGSDDYIYTAMYDMKEKNEISNIKSAYLMQPVILNYDNHKYIMFTAKMHQIFIKEVEKQLITTSVIDNKSVSFSFPDQLADFEVYVTKDDVTTRLTPLFYGSAVEAGITNYCWYLYTADNTVRVSFDPVAYMPEQGSDIKIIVKSTKGSEANFSYKENEINEIYADFISTYSSNKKLTCLIRCATDSENGRDRKTIKELKGLIPKMAMSRGYITTETDLNNYFNLISDDNNIIKLQKKVDNQLQRIWYAYYVLKDNYGNIVPANTFRINISINDPHVVEVSDGRYIIPTGTCFVYDAKKEFASIINETEIPPVYGEDYFDPDSNLYYYKAILNTVINVDPLYSAHYMTLINHESYFLYQWVNNKAPFGFSAVRNYFERKLLSDQNIYNFRFSIMQSVDIDYGLIKANLETGAIEVLKIKCFLVLYRDGVPYRYKDCDIEEFSTDFLTTKWKATIETDNKFDTKNRIHITNMYEYGYNSINEAYMDNNCQAYVYVAAKFNTVYSDEDKLLDKMSPGMSDMGYSLIDIYKVEGGCTLFENFTNIENTKVVMNKSEDGSKTNYDIFGVPMVGYHYFANENMVSYLVNALYDKKEYIDYCLSLIENTMGIDFKFFNTYGNSLTYTIGDKEKTPLDHIDLSLKFRLKLINSSDLATKDSIVQYIKDYIENLHELGDLHLPNLIHDISETYKDTIIYIEYMNFNNNRLGLNHIELQDVVDPQTVPEFICVRNRLADDGETLKPCIDVEIVKD